MNCDDGEIMRNNNSKDRVSLTRPDEEQTVCLPTISYGRLGDHLLYQKYLYQPLQRMMICLPTTKGKSGDENVGEEGRLKEEQSRQ